MKKLFPFILLLVFSGLLYFSDYDFGTVQKDISNSTELYQDGLLKSEYDKVNRIANYNIEAYFSPSSKSISVQEEIVWINKTNFPASEIQFHLYANAYKSNNTLFAKAYSLSPDAQTQIDIKSFRVNGEP